MGWASRYIEALGRGESIRFRPRGHSMKGKIASGQLCTVEPMRETDPLEAGDIVLCRVRGNDYLHLIHAIRDDRYLIGNNRGHLNGWISRSSIYGRCTSVDE